MIPLPIIAMLVRPLVGLAAQKFGEKNGKGAERKEFVVAKVLSVLDSMQNAGVLTDTDTADTKVDIGEAIEQALLDVRGADAIALDDSSTIRVYVEIRMK